MKKPLQAPIASGSLAIVKAISWDNGNILGLKLQQISSAYPIPCMAGFDIEPSVLMVT